MTGCVGDCPREQVKQDAVSIGVIGDAETIVRGGYYPSNVDKKGKPTNQLVKKDDLLAGTCSVWRMAENALSKPQIVEKLSERPLLKVVVGAEAAAIRSVPLATGGRAFCVVDECICDQAGGKHPAHAHIAICAAAKAAGLKKEDEAFIQAHRDLVSLMKKTTLWTPPADLAA